MEETAAAQEFQPEETAVRPLGGGATAGLGLLCLTCGYAVMGLVVWGLPQVGATKQEILMAAGSALAMVGILGVGFCTRERGGWARYCALKLPDWRQTLGWALAMVGVLIVLGLALRLGGYDTVPEWSRDLLRGVEGWTLAGLAIVVVLAAPFWEELLFRGFLFRGWANSRMRPAGAIVLTSACWAVLHGQQYHWIYLTVIWLLGCFFGYVRYRTGSLWLCIFLHALNNLAAFAQTMWALGQV